MIGRSTAPIWSDDVDATAYANELRDAPIVEAESGIQFISLTRNLQSDEMASPGIVTRTSVRELWGLVFEHSSGIGGKRVLVTGRPGIGKSRTLCYFLRLLLRKQKTVIFQSFKDENVWRFSYIDGSYSVDKAALFGFVHTFCDELQSHSCFFLVDTAKESESPPGCVAPTILASSPSLKHYSQFVSADSIAKYYMPPYELDEVIAAVPFFTQSVQNRVAFAGETIDEKLIISRFREVGGAPRYLLNGVAYEGLLDRIDAKIQDSHMKKLLVSLSSEKFPDLEASKENVAPLSSTFACYFSTTPFSRKDATVSFISEGVVQLVSEKLPMEMWQYFLSLSNESSHKTNLFEIISLEFLSKGATYDYFYIPMNSSAPTSEIHISETKSQVKVERSEAIPMLANLDHIAAPMKINNPTFDAVGPGHIAYQCTVSNDHDVKESGARELMKLSGGKPVEFCFLVPPDAFDAWKKKRKHKDITPPAGKLIPWVQIMGESKQKVIKVKPLEGSIKELLLSKIP